MFIMKKMTTDNFNDNLLAGIVNLIVIL